MIASYRDWTLPHALCIKSRCLLSSAAREKQQQRCCLLKWQCVPACPSWMTAWPWWVIHQWGILGQHSQTFALRVLSLSIQNTIAPPSVAYTTNFLSGTQLRSQWVWGEMGMNHVSGMVGTRGGGEGVRAEECCRAHGEQVQQLPQGA